MDRSAKRVIATIGCLFLAFSDFLCEPAAGKAISTPHRSHRAVGQLARSGFIGFTSRLKFPLAPTTAG